MARYLYFEGNTEIRRISCSKDASLPTIISPERRSFLKGLATLGVGTTVFPFLSRAEKMAPSALAAAGDQASGTAAGLASDTIIWHGFDRHDFIMDEQTLAITPFVAPAKGAAGNVASPRAASACVRGPRSKPQGELTGGAEALQETRRFAPGDSQIGRRALPIGAGSCRARSGLYYAPDRVGLDVRAQPSTATRRILWLQT
jgi:hypothetical protein